MVELKKQNFEENKELYNSIKLELYKKISNSIPIDHVGSTAIPDMYGKNIIDILIGVETKEEFNEISNILVEMNYVPSQNSKTNIYQFFASTQNETTMGDIHIHLVVKNTERFNDFILLRDYLLKNTLEAEKYLNYKKQILNNFGADRETYRKIKSEYVTSLIKKAKEALN